ncbi:AlbA family DNA-binding domain-containing protein [Mucilaginibacter sp. R-33]|uniref:AlbA family DNA-binding domain-containing protein n=1 Tax=Mucilaginibacter sp. R-33 TaxID=3416711 RepID=UPI003CF32286
MSDFQNKTEYYLEDIISLIDNEVEESIHLDFKEAGSFDKSDGKKKEISKDVSAFANSDGGIIIYGVKEENHKASGLSYIDGNIYTKEWLEQTINSSVQKRIADLKIYPIRSEGNINQSIYVVKIPKSYDAPHMCRDKRFYKRFNFESVMMEEYEVRESYGRKLKSKLLLKEWSIGRQNDRSNPIGRIKHIFQVDILNEGDVIESDFKVNVYFINYNLINITWDQYQGYEFTRLNNNRMKISSNGKTTIYPNEQINAMRFNFDIPDDKIASALKDLKIEVILLYQNGESKMEGDVKQLEYKLLLEYPNQR